MAKLNQDQEDKLKQLEEAHNRYKIARVTVRRDIEQQITERLSSLRAESERLAFEAHEMGIPKRQIGRKGLGTSDPNTTTKYVKAGKERLYPT